MTAETEGRVEFLHLNVEHRQPMRGVESARFIAGVGIEDDRHATPRSERQGYQVLLMDKETLDALGLPPGDIKENVTTVGVDVNALQPGQRVAIGDAIVEVSKPCAPCSRMEEIRSGLQDELADRRGMLAGVVQSGTVKPGDAVRVVEPATAG